MHLSYFSLHCKLAKHAACLIASEHWIFSSAISVRQSRYLSYSLATECGTVILFHQILISVNVTEIIDKNYNTNFFFQNVVILKTKQFLRFISPDSEFLGKTVNSSRSQTSLLSRHMTSCNFSLLSKYNVPSKKSRLENTNAIYKTRQRSYTTFQKCFCQGCKSWAKFVMIQST